MRSLSAPSNSLTVLTLGMLLAWPGVAATSDPIPEGTPNGFVVHRGTNISHWLSQSGRRGDERKQFFTAEDVALIERLGYDHVRLPVEFAGIRYSERPVDTGVGRHPSTSRRRFAR